MNTVIWLGSLIALAIAGYMFSARVEHLPQEAPGLVQNASQPINYAAISSAIMTLTQPISVAQAYQAIPHKQTPFNPTISSLPPQEKEYLYLLFTLVDKGVTERILWQIALMRGQSPMSNNYPKIIAHMDALTPPAALGKLHAQVIGAMRAQHRYLLQMQSAGQTQVDVNAQEVNLVSQNLHEAYGLLMQQYSTESAKNKEAFFDHLCALDFK